MDNLSDKRSFYMKDEKNIPKTKKRKWLKITLIILAVLFVAGGAVAFKTGYILNKVSTKGGLFSSLVHSIPGVGDTIKGEKEDRINILLLGMRGENVPGGGLLADTIMVMSIKPSENKVAMISIPRDLYVQVPGTENKEKINAVYAHGMERGKQGGIEDMERVVGEITGVPVNYGVSINFKGFTDLVDAVGGIDVSLDKPFNESEQFNQEHVCDGDKGGVFTTPTGKFETHYYTRNDGTKYISEQYPLCTNSSPECGGDFTLPAGNNHLDGIKALCYSRSRYQTSDFERAKRQQVVIQKIKDKATSIGTLSNFEKLNSILDALGNNVSTDMQAWEMKKAFSIYQGIQNPQVIQRVLEDTEEGLLYHPQESNGAGYILLPRGDNYDRMKNLFQNIFTLGNQSDSKPR
jgi:polyisoprenyl-teichoic acid--peptidoglycan teichoic acid transferase